MLPWLHDISSRLFPDKQLSESETFPFVTVPLVLRIVPLSESVQSKSSDWAKAAKGKINNKKAI
jgi:hypothetical protein